MSRKKRFHTLVIVAVNLLRTVNSVADVAGSPAAPLKAVTGLALMIVELVQGYQCYTVELKEFCPYLAISAAAVVGKFHDAKLNAEDLRKDLGSLLQVMDDIRLKLEKHEEKRYKFFVWLKNRHLVEKLRKELDDAIHRFKFDIAMSTARDVNILRQLFESWKPEIIVKQICETLGQDIVMASSPSGDNKTPFQKSKCCYPGTRKAILDDLLQWSQTEKPSDKAEIRLLADVVGSGKSTIAHTFARDCCHRKVLGASYFFDSKVSSQNDTSSVIKVIATNLAAFDEALGLQISLSKRKHPTENLPDEFRYYIVEPFQQWTSQRRLIIVLDALDEVADNSEFLKVLRDQVPTIPGNVGFFLTSRQEPDIMSFLSENPPHIRHLSIEIHSDTNKSDLEAYIRGRLEEIAPKKLKWLSSKWPTDKEVSRFVSKAEGLFIWAATICDYLMSEAASSPALDLELILSAQPNQIGLDATAKMSTLYSTILKRCQWKGSFPIAYQAVMGAIVAAVHFVASGPYRLGFLFTSRCLLEIHILHLSFRDFLTNPDQSKEPYFIDPTKHSGILALKCLQLMNREFVKGVEGSGYLKTDAAHAELPKFDVSDDVWYACEFWQDHLADRQAEPCDDQALLDALRLFLVKNITTWLEISASKGRLHPVLRPCLRRYLQILCPEKPEAALPGGFHITLYRLAKRISNLGRPEEGYQVSTEAIDLFRLIPTSPDNFDSALVLATLAHAAILVLVRRHEESLELGRKTIESLRALGDQDDPLFLVCLSRLLHNVAVGLQGLFGGIKEALTLVTEAVKLQRRLARSSDFELLKDLPLMVSTTASCYMHLFRPFEATEAAEEAVSLYREFLPLHPAFAPKLARALVILSDCLASQGRGEFALLAIQEAITISRDLVIRDPAMTRTLVEHLQTLAQRFGDLRLYSDAITATNDAIALLRDLAKKSSSVHMDISDNMMILSRWLACDSQNEKALEVTTQCVDLIKREITTAATDAEILNEQLSKALRARSLRLGALGRIQESDDVYVEAQRTLAPSWMPETL
ncbi:hypothetical protein C8J56DRAFT_1050093 [Mycena floridula]|nr:hypothetical protein C8J56DRAFT_1050093 [Mycena floridula]